MDKKKAYLMTGGTGYFGSHLLKKLIYRDVDLIVLKRSRSDLSRIADLADRLTFVDLDKADCEKIFSSHKIDTIIHCATNYGRGAGDLSEVTESNVQFPSKLLDLSKKFQARCFMNCDTILDDNINPYTQTKCRFRQMLKASADEILCLNIAFDSFYGPYDDESKFITGIVRKLLNQDKNIDLTEGRQKRSLIYIDDAIEAFVRVLDQSEALTEGFHHFQVGSTETEEIRRVVELAKDLTGNTKTHLNFGALAYRKNEDMAPHLDLSGLKQLGWEPKISLTDGLNRTIEAERIGVTT